MYSKVEGAKCQTEGAESSVSKSRALVPGILCLELGWSALVSDDDSYCQIVLNALEMCVIQDGDWTWISAEYLYTMRGNSFISVVNTFKMPVFSVNSWNYLFIIGKQFCKTD